MKKILYVFLIWLALFSGARAADFSRPHITVYGEAEEKVVPDRMVWYLNVTHKGTVLKEVAGTHARMVGDVLAFLKKSDIPGDAVQTSRMRFGENWNYRNSSRIREGFFAATDIMFKLSELDRYDELWMKFSGYENLSITAVAYEISDDAQFYRDLRRRALISAREKAQRMAGVLDSAIGETLAIEEAPPATGQRYESPRMLASDSAAQGGGQPAVAPGTLTLSTRVTVVFGLTGSNQ